MNEKLKEINQELAHAEAMLQKAQQKEKMLEHQKKILTRKERTHRLCTRGAMLERYFSDPEAVTDSQVSTILQLLFRKNDTRQLIEEILSNNTE